jgi:hypothetical protein
LRSKKEKGEHLLRSKVGMESLDEKPRGGTERNCIKSKTRKFNP